MLNVPSNLGERILELARIMAALDDEMKSGATPWEWNVDVAPTMRAAAFEGSAEE